PRVHRRPGGGDAQHRGGRLAGLAAGGGHRHPARGPGRHRGGQAGDRVRGRVVGVRAAAGPQRGDRPVSATEIDLDPATGSAPPEPRPDTGEASSPGASAVVGSSRKTRWLARGAVLAATTALWWLGTQVMFAGNEVVSRMGPWSAVSELVAMLGRPETWQAVSVSLG